MKVTARDLKALGVIDEVIPEPAGGAHSDWDRTAEALHDSLSRQVRELCALPTEDLLRRRREKYLAMGEWRTAEAY